MPNSKNKQDSLKWNKKPLESRILEGFCLYVPFLYKKSIPSFTSGSKMNFIGFLQENSSHMKINLFHKSPEIDLHLIYITSFNLTRNYLWKSIIYCKIDSAAVEIDDSIGLIAVRTTMNHILLLGATLFIRDLRRNMDMQQEPFAT